MSLEDANPLGEVISICSSEDDLTPTSKRRPNKSWNKDNNSDGSDHRSKRAKRSSASAPAEQTPRAGSTASEEGEVDETSAAPQPKLRAKINGIRVKRETVIDSREQSHTGQTDTSGAFVPPNGPSFTYESTTYKLAVLSSQRAGSWNNRFRDWTNVFCTNNAPQASTITPVVVYAAYSHFLDACSGLVSKKKKTAKQTAKQLEDDGTLSRWIEDLKNTGGSTNNNTSGHTQQESNTSRPKPHPNPQKEPAAATEVATTIALEGEVEEEEYVPSLETTEAATNGDAIPDNCDGDQSTTESQIPDLIVSENELQHMHRYFPSASNPIIMCLLCGQPGHVSGNCANTLCKYCNAGDHWSFSCPSRERCGNCRQLGHHKSSCSAAQKLANSRNEQLICTHCSSSDHLDDECTEPWRSFVPSSETIQTVVSIFPSCSACGSGHHFSADCATRRRQVSGNPTWSLKNGERYSDKSNTTRAIADEASSEASKGQDLKIRGHLTRKTNVIHYSSDDSEGEFLGNKAVKKPAPAIRLSSNIQMPNSMLGNGRSPIQAPPPPPSQPSGFRPGPPPQAPRGQGSFSQLREQSNGISIRGHATAAFHGLPPRPPPNYRNVPPPPQQQMQPRRPQRSHNQDNNNGSGHSRGEHRGGRAGGRGGNGGRGGGRGRGGRGKKF